MVQPYMKLGSVMFPKPTGIMINMMPFVFGDPNSLPEYLRGWLPVINQCSLRKGSISYLTVNESHVEAGKTQRRPGIHTEGFNAGDFGGGWGGGKWGGLRAGVYMASSDGSCRVWDCLTYDVDGHGGLLAAPESPCEDMEPGVLYWLTDRTPHEALPAKASGTRQFVRVVSEDVSVWFSKHNTPNPLGIKPGCPVVDYDKFEVRA